MNVMRLGLAWGVVAAVGVAGGLALADDGWRVEVGPIRQWGIKMEVDGPPVSLSRSSWFPLPGVNSKVMLAQTQGVRPGAASLTSPTDNLQFGDRTFDDGFVRLDIWTIDPAVPPERFGTTWNWGYQNASQYNPELLTLTFHRQSTVASSARVSASTVYLEKQTSRDVQRDDEVKGSDKTSADGLQVNAKRHWRSWGKWRVEINAGAAWFPDIDTSVRANPFVMLIRQNTYRVSSAQQIDATYRTSYRETYTYGDQFGRLDPNLAPLPDVVGPLPYNGPVDPISGPGPLLPNRPEQYSVVATGAGLTQTSTGARQSKARVGTRVWAVSDSVAVDANLDRVRLAFGPELSRVMKGRLRPHVAPQLTLNLVDADVDRHETGTVIDTASGRITSTATRSAHGSDTDCLVGILVVAGADLQLSEHWVLIADAGYEWLQQKMSVDVGPDRASFDLSGWEASVRVGRKF